METPRTSAVATPQREARKGASGRSAGDDDKPYFSGPRRPSAELKNSRPQRAATATATEKGRPPSPMTGGIKDRGGRQVLLVRPSRSRVLVSGLASASDVNP